MQIVTPWAPDGLRNLFRGNLGNKMSMYALLYLWKIKYGYDVYITKPVHDHLNYVFQNLGNCQNRSWQSIEYHYSLLGFDRSSSTQSSAFWLKSSSKHKLTSNLLHAVSMQSLTIIWALFNVYYKKAKILCLVTVVMYLFWQCNIRHTSCRILTLWIWKVSKVV